MIFRTTAVLLAFLFWTGCEKVEEIRTSFDRATPHEQYTASLEQAGLIETALGQSWHEAGEAILDGAGPIDLPFHEIRYLDPAQPEAIGYRFDLQRGQQLMINVEAASSEVPRLFVDLFEAPRDSADVPRHLESADSTLAISYRVRRDRAYLLRVQPELLWGGRVRITIQTDASLAFPVAGKDTGAIRSVFGDSRDGGRRRHHGVDIFAPRGTPTLAAADGVVSRVRNGGLGGKVVWLRDRYGQSLYYAHLDSQLVQRGQRVQVGDTLGLVGNTGNARTTPPHLHFGIYSNGPIDPFPFLYRPRTHPPAVRVDTTRLGEWTRVASSEAPMRLAPHNNAEILHTLPRNTALYVSGGSDTWYHVVLPDSTAGYLAAALVEPTQQPIRQIRLASGQPVRHRPTATAPAIDSLAADATVAVLGQFTSFLLVEALTGRKGWIGAE